MAQTKHIEKMHEKPWKSFKKSCLQVSHSCYWFNLKLFIVFFESPWSTNILSYHDVKFYYGNMVDNNITIFFRRCTPNCIWGILSALCSGVIPGGAEGTRHDRELKSSFQYESMCCRPSNSLQPNIIFQTCSATVPFHHWSANYLDSCS